MTASHRCRVIEHSGAWLFVCANRHAQALIITYCRTNHGRSHGSQSMWQPSYWDDPHNGYTRLPAVMIRDSKLAFELMLSFA